MEICVNNNDTNVNITCSTGFFIVVVQPGLSSIGKGSVSQFSSVQVTCTEFLKQNDKAGYADFTRLAFILKGPDQATWVLSKFISDIPSQPECQTTLQLQSGSQRTS